MQVHSPTLATCMYDTGEGVAKDLEQAVVWYRRSAEQGYAEAQYNLGVKYANGQGVEQDTKEAIRWLQKAVKQGDEDARSALGHIYAQLKDALGVPSSQNMHQPFGFYFDEDEINLDQLIRDLQNIVEAE